MDWWFFQDNAPTGASVLAEAAQVPASLMDNPTAQLLLGSVKLEIGGLNTDDGTLARTWQKWPALDDAPRALIWIAGVKQTRLGGYSRAKQPADYGNEALNALVGALRDECADEYEHWLMPTMPTRGHTLEVPFNVRARYDEMFAPAPAAIRDLLLAEIEIQWAWTARGQGYAGAVRPEAWREFQMHLEEARGRLVRAMDAAPGHWLPIARMMEVAQLTSASAAERRAWLVRSLRAQPGCYIAWTHYLNSNLSRWHGSREVLENLALELALEMDWATDLPLVFEKSLAFLQQDTDELNSEIIGHGAMTKAWRTFVDGIPDRPRPGAAAVWLRANLFVFFQSYHAGNYDDAAAVIRRLGEGDLAARIADGEGNPIYSFDFLRASALARSGKAGAVFQRAEAAQAAGEAREAARLFLGLAGELDDPAARELSRARAASANLQAEWTAPAADVPVAAPAGPPPFFPIKGGLVTNGTEPGLFAPDDQNAVACLWLKPDTAWRLSVVFDVTEQSRATTGIYWGDPDSGAGLLVRAPNGWAGKLLPAKIRNLSHVEIDAREDTVEPVPTRRMTAAWDGRTLKLEAQVGDRVWKHQAEPEIPGRPSIWILAVLARSKQGALQAVPLKDLVFTRQETVPAAPAAEPGRVASKQDAPGDVVQTQPTTFTLPL